MDEKDNYMEKLIEEASNQFKITLKLLNNQPSAKLAFFYFLFKDLINIDEDIIKDTDIDDIINYSKNIIFYNLEYIYDSIYDTDKNLLSEFEKKLKKQINISNIKIKECDEHLKILKNIYINEYISTYFSLNFDSINLNFENKKVLIMENDEKNKLILGEFFIRFLFILVISENTKNNDINKLMNNFYDYDIINNYINSDYTINNFSSISVNFKYWIILLFLIGNIFDKNSIYNTIFNKNEFKKLINEILNEDKKKKELEKQKEKEKEKKKLKGGKPNNKKNNIKIISNYKNKFNKYFNNITYEGKKLEIIYIFPYHTNIINYFHNQLIQKNIDPNKYNLNIKLKNPFSNNYIPIKDLLPNITDSSKINSELKHIKFDIYESLNLLINIDNLNEINEFLIKLKKKFILLLIYLYSIKKNIYIEYIECINDIFKINEQPNNNIINNINKQKINNIKKQNNINNQINNENFIYKNILEGNNTQKNIKDIEFKIKNLKKKNNIDSDIEILRLEKEIQKLIINKYNKIRYKLNQ